MREKVNKWAKALLAGLVPAFLFYIIFKAPGISQGVYTIFTSDLNGQYVDYFLYFRNAMLNHERLGYSFSVLLGDSMMALVGYYLLSPFNLLLLVFPPEKIGIAIYLIVLSKVTMAGMTSFLYWGRKRDYDIKMVLFSSTYAMSGFVVSYFMNVMWLDGLYILPLVAIGLDKVVEQRKKVFYILSLTVSFVTCYYVGYMIAGFSLLYFLYRVHSEKRGFKECAKCYGDFFLSSLIATCLSAVTLLPTVIAQMGSRGNGGNVLTNQSLMEVLSGFFTGTYSIDEFTAGAPHIYCGMLPVVLVIIYFMPHKGKTESRKRICAAVLLSGFLLSFIFGALDIVWHLFSVPNSFTHRYTFAFIFAMLIVAEECFSKDLKQVPLPTILMVDLVVALMGIGVVMSGVEAINVIWVVIDVTVAVVVSILCYFMYRASGDAQRTIMAYAMAIQGIFLAINGWIYVGVHQYDDHSHEGFYMEMYPIVDTVKEMDDSLYRMEKGFFNSNNDAMALSYNGLSHFSSASSKEPRDFVGLMGYSKQYDYWAFYDMGASIAGDSLLGIKYFLSKENVPHYQYRDTVNEIMIYENPYALPLGVMSEGAINEIELIEDKPFENQEKIYQALYGENKSLFRYYQYQTNTKNVIYENRDGYSNYTVQGEEKGEIIYRFKTVDDNPVYLYCGTAHNSVVAVTVNGEDKGEYLHAYRQGVFYLGEFKEGTEVEVKFTLVGSGASYKEPSIASLNMDVLKTITNRVKDGAWQVLTWENGAVEASIDVEKAGQLFLSIPYDENWEILIDGVQVEALEVLDALMALEVEAGVHHIAMNYKNAGAGEGILITAVGILAMGAVIALEEKRNKQKTIKSN